MTDWPFQGLRRGAYGAILADPPWAFRTYSGNDTIPHRTAAEPYPVMALGDLARLPVQDLAARDCVLFLWANDPLLPEGLWLGKMWGFTYKTRGFEWNKGSIGMGYWTRKQTELCLLFTRGKPKRLSKGVRQLIEAPRREHSRKPDEQYDGIEALVGGPYCELFAKYRRKNWEGWGNEYPKIDTRRHITSLIDGFRERIGAATPEAGD